MAFGICQSLYLELHVVIALSPPFRLPNLLANPTRQTIPFSKRACPVTLWKMSVSSKLRTDTSLQSSTASTLSRKVPITLIFFVVVLVCFTIVQTYRPNFATLGPLDPVKQSVDISRRKAIKCIRPLDMENAREGLGAILRRNQLALFIADVYGAQISWPSMKSSHGYHTDSFFTTCDNATDNCKVKQGNMVLPRCPRGDCACLWRGVQNYITPKENECEILGIKNDRLVTQEYSGCTRSVMRRYFVRPEAPAFEYDVIHYRMGDLKKEPGKKRPSEVELYYMLEAMCKTSERDIYVLTEGYPTIPFVSCFDRIVMASDTSLSDAFSIIRHAKTISVGSSSFSIVLAEVAEPTAVVTLHRTLALYEWVNTENWTVVLERGEHFHFNSKKMMIDVLLSGKDYRSRTYRREGWFNATGFKMLKVPRKYNESTFWVQNN